MLRDLLFGLLMIVAIVAYIAVQNARLDHAQDQAASAGARAATLTIERDAARNNVRVVTRYVDRVRIVRERGATITREIPAHVTPQADARCPVPVGFVRVHNAAAQNLPLHRPAADPDAPAPGVTLSAVAATVAGNYGTCHVVREQLLALQDYLRGLQQAHAPTE